MLITPLPTPPSTGDPTTFNARADALIGALPLLTDHVNAMISGLPATCPVRGSGATCATGVATAVYLIEKTTYKFTLLVAYANPTLGANYMAAAIIMSDGTVNVIKTAFNGANLTLTISGDYVMATQTSGVSKLIMFRYFRF